MNRNTRLLAHAALIGALYAALTYLQNLLIPLVYYCIIGLAATELINASLANLLCDEHLNPKIVDQVDTETTL